jgi:hypothetical protein
MYRRLPHAPRARRGAGLYPRIDAQGPERKAGATSTCARERARIDKCRQRYTAVGAVDIALYGGVKVVALEGHARSASHPHALWQTCPFARDISAFLGAGARRLGESRRRRPGICLTTSPAREWQSIAFTPPSHPTGGGAALGWVGAPAGLVQTVSMRSQVLYSVPPHNMSVNTDACGRPLPSVAPSPGRRLRSR